MFLTLFNSITLYSIYFFFFTLPGTTKQNDPMKHTDVTTAILMTPLPKNGRIIELKILMGKLDYNKNKSHGYTINVYEKVENNIQHNMKTNVDAYSNLHFQSEDSSDDEDEHNDHNEHNEQNPETNSKLPSVMFHIGDRVTCSMPNPDSQNVNADGPKTGIVLRSTFNSERGYIYQLKYNDGTFDMVPEFLLSQPETSEQHISHLHAFKVVSVTPINKVKTNSSKTYGYACDIRILKGQYIGLSHTSGSLDIYYSPSWPRNEPNIFRYTFSRGLTPECNLKDHVEYHCVQSDVSTWGFATTVRYDEMEDAEPMLHLSRPLIRRMDQRNSSGGGNGGSSYVYELTSSSGDDSDGIVYTDQNNWGREDGIEDWDMDQQD